MAGGGDAEDGLGGAEGVGEAGEERGSGVLGDLPVEGVNGDGDVHVAEEQAENGEGAEEDDQYVGEEGHDARVTVGAVVVHQRAAHHTHRRPNQRHRRRTLLLRFSTIFASFKSIRIQLIPT